AQQAGDRRDDPLSRNWRVRACGCASNVGPTADKGPSAALDSGFVRSTYGKYDSLSTPESALHLDPSRRPARNANALVARRLHERHIACGSACIRETIEIVFADFGSGRLLLHESGRNQAGAGECFTRF